MSNYRRLLLKGGTYFFTVVTYKRQPLLCEEHALSRLKAAFRYVMKTHPYRMGGCFDTDVQRTKECRARGYCSFARPTPEHFQGYFLRKNSERLM